MVISKFDCNIQGEKSSSQHTQLCRKQWCFSTEVHHIQSTNLLKQCNKWNKKPRVSPWLARWQHAREKKTYNSRTL